MSEPVVDKAVEQPKAGKKEKKEKKRKREDKPAASDDKADEATAGLSLFGAKKDDELDDLFGKSAVYAQAVPKAAPAPVKQAPEPVQALPLPDGTRTNRKRKAAVESSEDTKMASAVAEVQQPVASSSKSPAAKAKPSANASAAAIAQPDGDDENDEEIGSEQDGEEDGGDDDDEDMDSDAVSELVHESLKPKKDKGKKKAKFVPEEETREDRDRRTIFVGNLPVECAKSKLKSHILTFAPTAKIESVRFRSVAFATPTAPAPVDTTKDDPNETAEKRAKREQGRAAAWRAQQDAIAEGGRAAEEADRAKTFLDAKGKRKVAFIKKDFHSELASCNAYIVFGHPAPNRAANVAPILDPYEAATKALAANASIFMSRTIRVDSVRLPAAAALQNAKTALAKRDAWLPSGTDPKKSVFVGGLDYAAKEEDVRVFFEELVKKEKGAAKRGEDGEARWVTSVRLVRDKETQMGKGFGYVHFTDRETAEEILALNTASDVRLKFAKKPLRIQPCKTLPTANSRPIPAAPSAGTGGQDKAAQPAARTYISPALAPKGNPKLGDKLKDLSKDERKVAKASDADRQARRLAKKKLRHQLEKQEDKGAVKLGPTRGDKDKGKKLAGGKKSRVRSDKAYSKMKGTRQ